MTLSAYNGARCCYTAATSGTRVGGQGVRAGIGHRFQFIEGDNAMELGLQGKHAIVTGGSRGIGKAIALELAREGVDVAIVARSKEQLEATARELAAETGRRVIPLAADVTSKEQVDSMAVQLGRHGITVNCIHPGTTRTERTPGLLAARAAQLGVTPEEAEQRDFAPDSPRGNAICRMVDGAEIAYLTVFLASDKAWAVSGELVVATGGAGRSVYY